MKISCGWEDVFSVKIEQFSIECRKTKTNFYENDDTFETKFVRHVSVAQRPSSVESGIKLKLHFNYNTKQR